MTVSGAIYIVPILHLGRAGFPMKLVVRSSEDAASVNIVEHLLRLGAWEPAGDFEGAPVLRRGDSWVVTIPVHHLFYDDIDDKVEHALGERPSLVIFASRHKSASNLRTLTVHPIGNYGRAEMGGRDRTLVPSAPREMTFAFKEMVKRGGALEYQISLEATHHGPHLRTQTFYIEIGSDEMAWKAPEPARAIAAALFEVLANPAPESPIAVGVGGGHYVPRITDVARTKNIAFGHMLPSYALEQGWSPETLELMLGATPGAKLVYFHKKAIKTPVLREMEAWFRQRGVEPVSSKALD
jgi:D-aminoacyl-tRNA deacylase